jgi:hypothetical protein
MVLFEQIVEGLTRTRRSGRRAGLALDGGARLEQGAGVALVFWRNSRGQRLRALPTCTGVERHAVDAAVNVDAAARAARIHFDRHRQAIPAARAAKYLVRRHQIWRLWPGGVLQLATRRARRRRRFRTARFPLLAIARVILIPALAVLSIAHEFIVCPPPGAVAIQLPGRVWACFDSYFAGRGAILTRTCTPAALALPLALPPSEC